MAEPLISALVAETVDPADVPLRDAWQQAVYEAEREKLNRQWGREVWAPVQVEPSQTERTYRQYQDDQRSFLSNEVNRLRTLLRESERRYSAAYGAENVEINKLRETVRLQAEEIEFLRGLINEEWGEE